jgi:hypothetical protein
MCRGGQSRRTARAGGVKEGGRGSGIGLASRRAAGTDGVKEGSQGSGVGVASA